MDNRTAEAEAAAAESGLPSGHLIYTKWPRDIESAMLSPDKKTIALYDRKGVYLTDARGRHIRKLGVRLFEKWASEQLAVTFLFRRDSRRVAVLTTLVYGEPIGAFVERLSTADVARGRVRMLREWADRVQGPGPITAERKLERWDEDSRYVILSGVIYDGVDMPIDARRTGVEKIVIKDIAKSHR